MSGLILEGSMSGIKLPINNIIQLHTVHETT